MSFSDYIKAGWKLCAIERGKKAPTHPKWNVNPIDAETADGVEGAGLLHALSGTCSLDIDHLEQARKWLAQHGIDVDALLDAPDAVRIDSGRPNRAKLIYKLKTPMRTVKPTMSGLELRCATGTGTSVQDVLPPSIHPDTKKAYRWLYPDPLKGDWRNLPAIPIKLLNVWRELAEPIKAEEPRNITTEKPSIDLDSLREAVNAHDPDCSYDEWVKLGMQCHQGTNGHVKGFETWNAWSAKSLKYPGQTAVFAKYQSFGKQSGGREVTAAALVAEMPAKAADFEVVAREPDAKAPVEPGARKAALEAVMKRFVFVACQEIYYDRDRGVQIGDKAIKHMLTPFMPYRNKKLVDPVAELMTNPDKLIVEALAFHPGEQHIFTHAGKQYGNTYNAHTIPEPVEPTADEMARIEWIFNRIEDVEFREWLRQFYAHLVQHPGIKIRSAPLILSKCEGNGKSMTAHLIPKILVGESYYAEVDQAALNSDHNDYLEGKWAISLTEFKASTRMDREIVTKKCERIVADDMVQINPKGRAGYTIPNYFVVTASTNKPDAIQLDEHNRKWAIHWLTAPAMTEEEKSWIFEGFLKTDRARAVLRHYFLNVPILSFSPNADALKTADRERMIRASTTLDYELMLTAFEQCSEPLSKDVVITQDVGDYVRRHCIAKPSNERIGAILREAPFNAIHLKWKLGKAQYRGWVLRQQTQWLSATGKQIMAYLNDEDVDIMS